MSAATQLIPLDCQITSTIVPVTFSWSATDASGIAAYVVYVKTDGGDWTLQKAIPSNARSFAVKAKDPAGNWSAYSCDTVSPSSFDDREFLSINSPWTSPR